MYTTKELITILKNTPVKIVFKAILTYELGDFDYKYTESEDKFLNKVFEEYMNNKSISGLLCDEVLQIIEDIREMRD